jgi:hypothetical protein
MGHESHHHPAPGDSLLGAPHGRHLSDRWLLLQRAHFPAAHSELGCFGSTLGAERILRVRWGAFRSRHPFRRNAVVPRWSRGVGEDDGAAAGLDVW